MSLCGEGSGVIAASCWSGEKDHLTGPKPAPVSGTHTNTHWHGLGVASDAVLLSPPYTHTHTHTSSFSTLTLRLSGVSKFFECKSNVYKVPIGA